MQEHLKITQRLQEFFMESSPTVITPIQGLEAATWPTLPHPTPTSGTAASWGLQWK